MQIALTFRHLEPDDGVKDYIEKRFKRLKKFMGNFREIHVILSQEKYRYIAEAKLILNGTQLNSQASGSDLYKAIDQMVEKIERQIREHKIKGKKKRSISISQKESKKEERDYFQDQDSMQLLSLIKKRIRLAKPMPIEEAISQLNILKENYFFFINSDSGQINAVYRSEDGRYEWIEPQPA